MATVIDHILIELELDPKKFDAATKKSAEAWMKLRQQAERAHKDTAEPLEGMSKAFGAVTTKVFAFVAAIVSIQKIKQFTSSVVSSNLTLAQMAKVTRDTVEDLSTFELAAQRAGVPIESTRKFIAGLGRDIGSLRVDPGAAEALVGVLNALKIDVNPDATALEKTKQILDALEKLGPSDRAAVLQRLPYADQAFIAYLMKGKTFINENLKAQKDILVVTKENIAATDKLNTAWETLMQTLQKLGRILLQDLHGPIIEALKAANTLASGGSLPEHGAETGHDTFETMRRPKEAPGLTGEGKRPMARTEPGWFRRSETFPLPPSRPPEAPHPDDTPEIPPKATPNQFSAGATATYRGAASYYSGLPSEGGAMTSTGERVNPASYTGALQSDLAKQYGGLRKSGVWGDVIDEKTGKRVRVYFNDTGPLRPGRIMDLSPQTFKEFGPLSKGVVPNMRLEILPNPPKGQKYIGGPVPEGQGGGVFDKGAPPLSWLSNPRLLRASRFNQMTNPTNNYATSEATVHSLIVNSAEKPVTDDAYGLSTDAIPALNRGMYVVDFEKGPF